MSDEAATHRAFAEQGAMRSRIAELEADLSSKVEQADVFHAEWRRAKDALADESARVEEFRSTLAETCKQRDAILERARLAEAALAKRDEVLTIAWRLCLQEAWGDLREHLDCTASVGPVARAEEGSEGG